MISPRLNNILAEARFLAGQKYIGLSIEVNVSNKIKSLYGKDVMQITKSLKTGEFVYVKDPNPPVMVRVPEFESTTQPMTIHTRRPFKLNLGEIVGHLIRLVILWSIVSIFF